MHNKRKRASRKLLKRVVPVLAVMWIVGAPDRAAHAQEFPTRTVRIVVPTAPGGSNDFIARLLVKELGRTWTQVVIVDNRPGAGGTIGFDAVAKAAPDGHTICLGSSQFTGSASIYSKLPYDARRDFVPVTLLAYAQWVLIVHPSLPVRSVKELIAFAKSRPGQLSYASSGTGSGAHFGGELLQRMTGIKMVHVPYKGAALMVTDVIAGQVQLTMTGLGGAMPHAASGKVRALAVTGKNRSAVAPDVPTIGETVPGFQFNNWFGVFVARATPNDIVAQLHASFVRAVQTKEVSQPLLAQSIEPAGTSSAQFSDMVQQEIETWTRLAKELGVRAD